MSTAPWETGATKVVWSDLRLWPLSLNSAPIARTAAAVTIPPWGRGTSVHDWSISPSYRPDPGGEGMDVVATAKGLPTPEC